MNNEAQGLFNRNQLGHRYLDRWLRYSSVTDPLEVCSLLTPRHLSKSLVELFNELVRQDTSELFAEFAVEVSEILSIGRQVGGL